MLRGIDILAAAVKVTLGPKCRNVVLDKGFGTPLTDVWRRVALPLEGRVIDAAEWRNNVLSLSQTL